MKSLVLWFWGLCVACSPAVGPRAITPTGVAPVAWTAAEKREDIAIRTLRSTPHASYHWVHASGSERPHVHDRTDMLVFVVSGRVIMHIGEQHIEAVPGDVIDVPMGTPHWVENVASESSVAHVVFSPAFDGKDRRFLD